MSSDAPPEASEGKGSEEREGAEGSQELRQENIPKSQDRGVGKEVNKLQAAVIEHAVVRGKS